MRTRRSSIALLLSYVIALPAVALVSIGAPFVPAANATVSECDGPAPDGTPCNGSPVDDGNPCTVGACSGGLCVGDGTVAADGTVCFDLNECTDGFTCQGGHCGTPVVCTASDQCHSAGTCDPATGCSNPALPDDTTCSDGSLCTSSDHCAAGVCVGTLIDCLDDDKCTLDSCVPATGCQHDTITCDDHNKCTSDSCAKASGCQFDEIVCDDDNACTDDSCNEESGCQYTEISCDDQDACTSDSCDHTDGCHNDEVDCGDGNACTIDSCDQTDGCQYDAVSCDDLDACTDDTCDESGGCGHIDVSCDDHDACTTDTCDPSDGCHHETLPSCTGLPDLDHFQCYETQRPPLNLKGVTLHDQFGESTVTVRRGKRLCAPADNSVDPDHAAVMATGHLTAYTIKQTGRFTPPAPFEHDFTVRTKFGDLTVQLYRPERMMVPTAKDSEDADSDPDPVMDPPDHFKCYRVRGDHFTKKGVQIQTQFEPDPVTVDIKRPVHLCAPADKNDESHGAFDHTLHLMCFQVRAHPRQPRRVITDNQFGPATYDIYGLRELCVPAFKNPGECANGKIDDFDEDCDPPGAVCASDGRLCTSDCQCPAPRCGDGIRSNGEECEDGNTTAGDGCDGSCHVETCSPTTCQDGSGNCGTGGFSCADGGYVCCGFNFGGGQVGCFCGAPDTCEPAGGQICPGP